MFKQKKKPAKDYSYMGFAQLRRLQRELDGKDAQQHLNKVQKENLDRQLRNNRETEYTRIRNYLDSQVPVGHRNNHHAYKRMHEIDPFK